MSESPATAPLKRKRRWLQFSLRSLLVFTLLCAIAASFLGRKIERKRREQAIVDAIRGQGATVYYDYVGGLEPSGPVWLRSLLGKNFFNEVIDVAADGRRDPYDNWLVNLKELPELEILSLSYTEPTDAGLVNLNGLTKLRALYLDGTQVTEAGLVNLKGLTKLQQLDLRETHVTDAGLVNLKGLTQLQSLSLDGTYVTDAGLAELKGLTRLRDLSLHNTAVTSAGVSELQKARPMCIIRY